MPLKGTGLWALTVAVAVAGALPARAQVVLYVDDSSTSGLNNGSNWANAYVNLQDALLAASTNGVDEIRVAAGVYKPAPPGGPRTATFELVNGVALKGGYAGYGHPNPDEREPDVHETVLSGDLSGNDVGLYGPARNDNSYHVLVAIGLGASTVLEGFTVCAGQADGLWDDKTNCGGGLLVLDGVLGISGCAFRGNYAVGGGGLAFINTTVRTLEVKDCTFDSNGASAGWGAGAWTYLGDLRFVKCRIRGNDGGGVCCLGGPGIGQHLSPRFVNCYFASNGAYYGGAIYAECASPTAINSIFNGNTGTYAGAMYVTACTLGETAYVPCGPSLTTLINDTFVDNQGLVWYGGVYAVGHAEVFARNCIFWQSYGGECIPSHWHAIAFEGDDDCDPMTGVPSRAPNISYSAVGRLGEDCQWVWSPPWGGTGNIALYDQDPNGEICNPGFIDPVGADGYMGTGDEDLRIRWDSPFVDAGDNSTVPADTYDLDGDNDVLEPLPIDIGGGARFADVPGVFDSGAGVPPIVDMGAYEAVPECNDNGIPDDQDIAHGTSTDCNSNGTPDECEVGCSVDVVFILDTSGSMDSEGDTLCSTIGFLVAALAERGIDVHPLILGIDRSIPYPNCAGDVHYVLEEYGWSVPGATEYSLGQCSDGIQGSEEDWAPATAIVAHRRDWGEHRVRLIVPMSDEGPRCGNPVNTSGAESINDAAAVGLAVDFAACNRVIVSPVLGNGMDFENNHDDALTLALATQLAEVTRGQVFHTEYPAAELADGIEAIIRNACIAGGAALPDCNNNRIPDECEIAKGTSEDCNSNAIPDECDIAAGTSQDLNQNGVPDGCDPPILVSADSVGDHGGGLGELCIAVDPTDGVQDNIEPRIMTYAGDNLSIKVTFDKGIASASVAIAPPGPVVTPSIVGNVVELLYTTVPTNQYCYNFNMAGTIATDGGVFGSGGEDTDFCLCYLVADVDKSGAVGALDKNTVISGANWTKPANLAGDGPGVDIDRSGTVGALDKNTVISGANWTKALLNACP